MMNRGRLAGDLESQRYGVYALCNVAATRANHAQLCQAALAGTRASQREYFRNSKVRSRERVVVDW